MIEEQASECWHCGLSLSALAVGDDTSGAPTLPVAGVEGSGPTRRNETMIGREIIGQYVIREKLGEGGMGEVYLADQPAIGRQVAIKVVHAQLREREHDEHVERFRNEAKAAASLESPHIVQIFNWGEIEDGTLFMAMEYLSGRTLADVLHEQGPLEPELTVSIATQICTALSEAHAAGIVHRDLKPSNIMLIERGAEKNFTKVLDFGVAKLEGSDITRSGAMFGTPQYMSPEQLRAESIDGRSDLYSLGVMLFEMLAGELPFSSPTAVGFITAHLHQAPPPLPRSVPSALAEVIALLLAKEPNERPPDADSVAAELRAALAGGSPAARRRARRRVLRGSVSALLLVVGLGALGWGGWQAWRWRVELDQQHVRELELERERNRELKRKIAEQEAAVARIRAQAEEMTTAQMQSSTKVREQRLEVLEEDTHPPAAELDPKTRKMLGRSREQLEAELREVLDGRRIPPSEVADVWRSHAVRVGALEEGKISEAELREELVSMIALYRKNFEPRAAYERVSLTELERRFMTMATKDELDEAARRELLEAIHESHDAQTELPEVDRAYFKRLALARLIREQTTTEKPPSPGPGPTPKPGPKSGPKPGSASPDRPPPRPEPDDGPLPPAEDEPEGTPGERALPSL
jgi:tRNA A-37 threonylcarbamoyl transferase component Bud32